jgi:endoglucanase
LRLRALILFCVLGCAAVFAQNEPTPASAVRHDEPAWEAAKRFMRGANIANYLEVPPGQKWRVIHTVEDLRLIRAEGFDHVRLPVGWHHYAGPGPEYKLSGNIFGKVDEMVTNATALGLGIIVNIHHFNEFTSNPPAYTAEFHAIWRQVAEHYAGAPDGVAFELLNEPKDAATTEVMKPIYAEAIREIRLTNPRRTIFVGPGRWNSPNELSRLRLPEEDRNIIVTLHCYQPFNFTHQGATWTGQELKAVTGIVFPGPPPHPLPVDPSLHLSRGMLDWINRYNTLPANRNPCSETAFQGLVQTAKAWSKKFNRPIHFGEFGAYTRADQASRARFYRAFREEMDREGMGWAIWDWKSGFNYWDPKNQEPLPGMREALFPMH